jgi:hypothetical protein
MGIVGQGIEEKVSQVMPGQMFGGRFARGENEPIRMHVPRGHFFA